MKHFATFAPHVPEAPPHFKLDGNGAHDSYHSEGKDGSLTVSVDKRLRVVVEISGLPNAAMAEWFKKIDAKKLAELKPEPKKAP